MVKKGKSINGLMRHIRNKHDTKIGGSKNKQDLLNMGYYHGYKALRYIKNRDNDQNYESFKQIQVLYNFDIKIKKMLYPYLILIETSLKNRLIDYLVTGESPSIEYIYKYMLTNYKNYSTGNNKYRKYLKRRLELRNKIDETLSYHYGKRNPVITHFFHNSKPIPLWAYFEVVSFGEFGNFIYSLHSDYKINFTDSLKINHSGLNQNGRILENIIFTLTPLRNAVMHNSIIFDCRFNNHDHSKQIKTYLEQMTGISNIQFNNIEDFIILIVFMLKNLDVNIRDLNNTISNFMNSTRIVEKSIPKSSYFQIFGTDINNKLTKLKSYINNNWLENV